MASPGEVNTPQDNDSGSEEANKYCGSSDGSGSIESTPHLELLVLLLQKKEMAGRERKLLISLKMKEFVEKIMKLRDESDKNYMELEEKLLQMEEQRQKDNRKFQMQLMSFLCSHQQGPSYTGQFSRSPYNYPPYL